MAFAAPSNSAPHTVVACATWLRCFKLEDALRRLKNIRKNIHLRTMLPLPKFFCRHPDVPAGARHDAGVPNKASPPPARLLSASAYCCHRVLSSKATAALWCWPVVPAYIKSVLNTTRRILAAKLSTIQDCEKNAKLNFKCEVKRSHVNF